MFYWRPWSTPNNSLEIKTKTPLVFLLIFVLGTKEPCLLDYSSTDIGDTCTTILSKDIELHLRSLLSSLWYQFLDSFFITVHCEGDDDTYDCLVRTSFFHQPRFCLINRRVLRRRNARELQVSSRNWGPRGRYMNGEEQVVVLAEDDTADSVSAARKLSFLPSFGNYIISARVQLDYLAYSILGRSHQILHTLLKEAQELHRSQEANRVGIYIADP
jgi:mitochondrial chaperone BCS1